MEDQHDAVVAAGHDEEHEDHFVLYWIIAGVLGAATLIEVFLADYMKGQGVSGGLIAGTMMAIAIFKAIQVLLFYMHLRWEKRLLWGTVLVPLFLVSLLALTLFAQP